MYELLIRVVSAVFHVLQMDLDPFLSNFYLWLTVPAKLVGKLTEIRPRADQKVLKHYFL